MYLRPGTVLVGRSAHGKKILAGIEYAVRSVSDDAFVVGMIAPWRTSDEDRATIADDEAGRKERARIAREQDEISLTHEETSRWLRLAYAITYYSAQGRTIQNRTILLLDTASKHFTTRNLIVGISRAPLGSQIKIPTVKDEEDLMKRLPVVPDEVDREAATDDEAEAEDSENE